jgi:hypothetical protein
MFSLVCEGIEVQQKLRPSRSFHPHFKVNGFGLLAMAHKKSRMIEQQGRPSWGIDEIHTDCCLKPYGLATILQWEEFSASFIHCRRSLASARATFVPPSRSF